VRLASVGNALYDIVAFVEPDFATRLGFLAGSTAHGERSQLEPVLAALGGGGSRGAGGGATNTARVFASLGHRASFAGSIGRDAIGRDFKADVMGTGVELFLQEGDSPTGVFCVLITPDGERTIVVAPGAALGVKAETIPDAFFSSDATLYIDGFLASRPETIETLIGRAARCGMRIALDVAGFRIATRHREFFLRLIRESCSWTFMNEDEFIALAEAGVDEALQPFSAAAPGTVVVKRAEIGAVCVSDGYVLESAVRPIRATDTTGAGDAFAAGFLSAAFSGAPLARCLRLGNRVAEQAIQVAGLALDGQKLRRAAQTVI
jgi:sugar/nucleoside kinase (ribokinase family)